MSPYDDVYRQSIEAPEAFWSEAAKAITWVKPWDSVLDASNSPFCRWFPGAELNTCYNAVDRHADGERAEQAALIYDSAVAEGSRTYTFAQLRNETALFAGVLAGLGVEKGDRVVIYMPMVPETVIAMLACARLGAVHSVVFGGFAPRELATRIDDAQPRVIVSASCGIEGAKIIPYKPLLDEAIERSEHCPQACVILQRPEVTASLAPSRDQDWAQAMAAARPADCVTVKAEDPLYILYTSGTTGEPKGVVRDNGGHAVALHWTMKNVYGVEPGEVFWAASDVGWVVGHSYIVYGPLLHGNTTVLFEGKPVGTPDAGAFWRVAAEHDVATLFTAPTVFRAIKQKDPNGEFILQHDLSTLRTLFLAGERCDPGTLAWAEEKLGIPVIDHWWQTETGWPIAASCRGLGAPRVKPGSASQAVPGWDVAVVDADNRELPAGEMGEIVCRLPLPPGAFSTLWKHDDRFRETYMTKFPGCYETDDAGFLDEEGYLFVMSRTDDIINVAGHRLSTGAMEQVLGAHPDVAECAVIGPADSLKGQVPLGLLVLKDGVARSHDTILEELISNVRSDIGPVAAFKRALVVERLPKTRSGKILRKTMCKIADGKDWCAPPTIEDPQALEEIRVALAKLDYPRSQPR